MGGVAASGPEEELHRLWQGHALAGAAWHTLDRRQLEVLECGLHNLDAGPDFLDALIRLEGHLLRGDVEIHIRAADWYLHHHQSDPRYNRVILHVVAGACPDGFIARRQDGAIAPTLCIAPAAFLLPVPACPDHGAAEKRSCLLAGRAAPAVAARLDAAGEERLAMHAARLLEMRREDEWEQILYWGLLDALGYGKNQQPFRLLAQRLPFALLRAVIRELEEEAACRCSEALFFGVSGLLPQERHALAYVRELQRLWRRMRRTAGITPLAAESWRFFRLRPANFPTRRLAAAARLAVRFRRRGILEPLRRILAPRAAANTAWLELEALASVEIEGFWALHHDFSLAAPEAAPRPRIRLIGRGRSREIVVNVFLPALLAYAQESEDGHLGAAVRALYRAVPKPPENEVTRRMRHQLFAAAPPAPMLAAGTAIRQQGMIQLDQLYCRRGACASCTE